LKHSSRTDRILVAVALAILLLASGLFYFDSWMWGARRARGERIGTLVSQSGDVRLKYDDDFKWSKAGMGQDLAYNDAIYAGSDSVADLSVGETKLTVTQNTLIVLRREQNVNFLNLQFGTLFGSLAKNEKLMIDTGDGQLVGLSPTKDAQIVLRRADGKTSIDVTSGEATITFNGKTSKLDPNSRLVLGDKNPSLLRTRLKIVRPLGTDVIYSEDPAQVEFQWAWEGGAPAQPHERYEIEFSGNASINPVHITKVAQGQLRTSMSVTQTLALFFRVKGPHGEHSDIQQLRFVRIQKPVIIKPIAQEQILYPGNDPQTTVTLEFKKAKEQHVMYEIARDENFQMPWRKGVTSMERADVVLEPGQYFLRVRGDYGANRLSGWTEVRPFSVTRQPELHRLSSMRIPQRVVIPNRKYPADLYAASPEHVQDYLTGQGTLRRFFPFEESDIDQVRVQMESGARELITQNDTRWPVRKLYPIRHSYRFQALKAGSIPSKWSEVRRLEITMEPPRPLGDPTYSKVNEQGIRAAEWGMTPILFARSYDVEVSHSSLFESAVELHVKSTRVATELPRGEYYWRARARDHLGRVISDFSEPYKLPAPPDEVPQSLAQNEREPAAVGQSTAKKPTEQQPWEKSGWWAWFGSGMNYVNYKQSIPSRGTLVTENMKGPSQYVETGYRGDRGYGGVLSYKNTPGEIKINNANLDQASYNWTIISLEGLWQRRSPYDLFRRPVVYGFRAGVQQHKAPFLVLDSNADLKLRTAEMTTGSMGMLAQWMAKRWTYYWLMRYQFPLNSKVDGADTFQVKPVFAFDGSIGTSYRIGQQFKLGIFWYGQWHQYNFVYSDPDQTNPGFQSLFFSSVDLRLGIDF